MVRGIIYWYTKGGWALRSGKVLLTTLTLIGVGDWLFGTKRLGMMVAIMVCSVGAIVLYGPQIVKGLDLMDVVDLGPYQEALRRAFGLITGISEGIIEILFE